MSSRPRCKAARCIGDGLYGVDLKETKDGVFVIEVNDNPNLDHGWEDSGEKDEVWVRLTQWFLDRLDALSAGGPETPRALLRSAPLARRFQGEEPRQEALLHRLRRTRGEIEALGAEALRPAEEAAGFAGGEAGQHRSPRNRRRSGRRA